MMYHIALLDFSIQRGYLFTPLRSKYFLQKVAERRQTGIRPAALPQEKRNRPAHPGLSKGKSPFGLNQRMKHGKHIQVSESFLLCALLTITGGFLDVYTYITRGHVFANAQTGNVVLLGLNLAEGNIKEVAFYLFPIIAFALGILFTEWIRAKFKEYDLLHWRQIVVFYEALLLFFPAFMASGMWDTAVNILVSFVCAVQVESFRKVNGHSVATTMCTGNLRSATEQIFHYVRTRDPDTKKTILSYYEIVVFFALGATLGAALSALFAEKAILFCCLFLIIAFLSMFAKEI